MVADDAVAHRQPQAGALDRRLGGVERLEDGVHILGADADAGVADGHRHPLALQPGLHRDRALRVLAGVGGVGEQVEEHLLDLVGYDDNGRQAGGVVALHHDPLVLEIALLKQEERFQCGLHIHRPAQVRRGPVEIL